MSDVNSGNRFVLNFGGRPARRIVKEYETQSIDTEENYYCDRFDIFTSGGRFAIGRYPFNCSDHLYRIQKEFDADKSPLPPSGRRSMDYSKFNYDTVRLYFDILHGIEKKTNYPTVLEFLIFLGHDGQLKMESGIEEEVFVNLVKQVKVNERNLFISKEALALSWIYVKTWGEKANHLEVLWQLWKFDFQTIRQALTSVYTPDPDESNQHIIELTKLIRERFDTQTELFSWSQKLYQEMYNSHDQWYKWDESTYKNVRLASGHTLIKTGSNGFGLMVAASSKNETLLPFTSDSEQENFCWSIRIIHNEGTIAVGMTTWGKSNRKKILYHNTNGSVLDFGISKRIAPISGPDDKITLRFNSKELCLYLTKNDEKEIEICSKVPSNLEFYPVVEFVGSPGENYDTVKLVNHSWE